MSGSGSGVRCGGHVGPASREVVTPWRLELQSAEPESDILSIELRGLLRVAKIAKYRVSWCWVCFFFVVLLGEGWGSGKFSTFGVSNVICLTIAKV